MTYSSTLIAACVTVGVLVTGTTKAALATPEKPVADPAVAVEHRFAQLEARRQGDRHFQAEPEFPPDDYLGDVEIPGAQRPDASGPGLRAPGAGSLEHRDAPAFTPPAFGDGTDIPRRQRGEFPTPLPQERPRFRDAPGGGFDPWR